MSNVVLGGIPVGKGDLDYYLGCNILVKKICIIKAERCARRESVIERGQDGCLTCVAASNDAVKVASYSPRQRLDATKVTYLHMSYLQGTPDELATAQYR